MEIDGKSRENILSLISNAKSQQLLQKMGSINEQTGVLSKNEQSNSGRKLDKVGRRRSNSLTSPIMIPIEKQMASKAEQRARDRDNFLKLNLHYETASPPKKFGLRLRGSSLT